MMKRIAWSCLFLVGVVTAADIPTLINFQGRLTDESGVPLSGTLPATFRMYDVASGGDPMTCGDVGSSCLWEEQQMITSSSSGIYHVLLGDSNPLTPDVFRGVERYLSVEIDGEELDERFRITSVGFAHQAGELDGEPSSYYLERANHTGTQSPSTISPQGSGSGLDADTVGGLSAEQLVASAFSRRPRLYEDSFTSLNAEVDTAATMLTAAASASSTTLVVESTSGFDIGELIDIVGDPDFERREVADVPDSVTLTLASPLENAYAAGSLVGRYTVTVDTSSGILRFADEADLGDGSDGELVTSGNVNLDGSRSFTSLTVSASDVVTVATGSTIRVLDAVQIDGTLKVGVGDSAGGGDGGTPGNGRQGRSPIGSDPGMISQSPNGGGGGGGTQGPVGGGAGGGGSYGTGGSGGSGPGGQAGQAGVTYGDPQLSDSYGGSGGGGGASHSSSSGQSGGAAGGFLKVNGMTLTIGPGGTLSSPGLDGNVGAGAGSGGGGSGGAVYATVALLADIGTARMAAPGGLGGVSIGSGGSGGNGGKGRLRLESNQITGTSDPAFYNEGSLLRQARYRATYNATQTYQQKIETVAVSLTHNWTARFSPASTVSAGQPSLVHSGVDITDFFAIGDTVDIYTANNFTRERKTILNVQTTAPGETTLTFDSDFQNAYGPADFFARVDVLPVVSIRNDLDGEDETPLVWQESEVIGNEVLDYYTYVAPEPGNFVTLKIYFSRNDLGLSPEVSDLVVDLNR